MQGNWKKIANQNALKKAKAVEGEQVATYDGPLDVIICSPKGENGNGPWSITFLANQTKADSFQVMLKFLKECKGPKTHGWVFTYDPTSKNWYSIDNEGEPNMLKLKDFLQDDDTIAMFKDVRASPHLSS